MNLLVEISGGQILGIAASILGVLISAMITLLIYLGNAGSRLKGVVIDNTVKQAETAVRVQSISDKQTIHIASTDAAIEKINGKLDRILEK